MCFVLFVRLSVCVFLLCVWFVCDSLCDAVWFALMCYCVCVCSLLMCLCFLCLFYTVVLYGSLFVCVVDCASMLLLVNKSVCLFVSSCVMLYVVCVFMCLNTCVRVLL